MTIKKQLSESDIKAKFITPALLKAGWDEQTQIRREVFFTDGRIFVKGNLTQRGKGKKADYILYYKPNIPIAIVEAKSNKLSLNSGIQQALDYARILDIPSVSFNNAGVMNFALMSDSDNCFLMVIIR
jgi:type I restriction enzyme R subunit